MKKIIVTAFIVVVGLFVLPWNRINWGKLSMMPPEMVTVNGEARTTTQNQIASFNAGVDSVKDNKDEAIKEVNSKIEELIKAVKEFGIVDGDIQTQNMSVYQNEEMYYDNGVQKSRKGQWRVNNNVEIILRDITKANQLTEVLTKSGANNVYGPNFRMDDTSTIEKEMFDAAISDAREKAESIAKASGRKLGKVLNVVEGGSQNGVYPLFDQVEGRGGGGMPIEPGSATVTKSVSVSFELE